MDGSGAVGGWGLGGLHTVPALTKTSDLQLRCSHPATAIYYLLTEVTRALLHADATHKHGCFNRRGIIVLDLWPRIASERGATMIAQLCRTRPERAATRSVILRTVMTFIVQYFVYA